MNDFPTQGVSFQGASGAHHSIVRQHSNNRIRHMMQETKIMDALLQITASRQCTESLAWGLPIRSRGVGACVPGPVALLIPEGNWRKWTATGRSSVARHSGEAQRPSSAEAELSLVVDY